MLLALAGGAAGLALSSWCGTLIWTAVQHSMLNPLGQASAFTVSLAPDLPILAYTLLISLITGAAFGLAPALRSSRVDLTTALKDEGASLSGGGSRSRLRGWLVGAQVTISMLLLVASGLLVRGLTRSGAVSPGFDTSSLFWPVFPWPEDPARAAALERRVRDRLLELPEVRSVSILDRVPFTGTWTPPVEAAGSHVTGLRALGNYIDTRYFDTLGIPLDRGRVFTPADLSSNARVVIVSERAARQLWPNEDAIGKRLRVDLTFRNGWKEFEVIGVARSVASAHLSRIDPMYIYLPHPDSQPDNMLVRIQGDRGRALARIRAAFEEIDRDLMPGLSIVSLEDGPMRLEKVLLESVTMSAVALALLALGLASVGIYGVMSYLVSQRTREIGVMMALGADAGKVTLSVLRQGLTPVALGLAVGLAGGVGVSILVRSAMSFPDSSDPFYGLSLFDPVTFCGLPLVVAMIAMTASLLPLRRAIRVDPMVALRHE
jgi:predicted permease